MTFKDHTEYLCGTTIAKIKLLSRIAPFLPEDHNLMLYKTLIIPHYEYCDVVYDGLSKELAEKLQRLQNMCLQNLFSVNGRTPTTVVHDRAQLPFLKDRRCKKRCDNYV